MPCIDQERALLQIQCKDVDQATSLPKQGILHRNPYQIVVCRFLWCMQTYILFSVEINFIEVETYR